MNTPHRNLRVTIGLVFLKYIKGWVLAIKGKQIHLASTLHKHESSTLHFVTLESIRKALTLYYVGVISKQV